MWGDTEANVGGQGDLGLSMTYILSIGESRRREETGEQEKMLFFLE